MTLSTRWLRATGCLGRGWGVYTPPTNSHFAVLVFEGLGVTPRYFPLGSRVLTRDIAVYCRLAKLAYRVPLYAMRGAERGYSFCITNRLGGFGLHKG